MKTHFSETNQYMKYAYSLLFSLSILLTLSCGKESAPEIDLLDEPITTLNLTFSPINSSEAVVIFAYEDLGNTSGAPASISSEPLAINTAYEVTAAIVSRGRSAGSFKILTGAIERAGTDYQLFIDVSPDNVFQEIAYTDMDDQGNPIGIQTTVLASERFTIGSLRVTLVQNPDKSVSYTIGDKVPTNAGGMVELEAVFDVIIQ